MNKHLYRVIFNKKRNMQMVVADIAKTPNGNEKNEGREAQSRQKPVFVTLKQISLSILISLSLVTITSPVYGSNIVADKQANKREQPQVISTANGITQVNIQTPNNKGVSHNKYSQFDVSQRGAILNNSSKNSKTQIAGYVQGNELLRATGPAKIILNEVNSRNPSQLNGVIEVAGQKAQVVIANPSGITCNGCGFINASRGTLTTGKPVIENGELRGYVVEGGNISVTGKGLDSSQQDYTDLIARTVSLNSAVWANDVNVVTGRNRVSQDSRTVTPLEENTTNKPEVSIDVSQLGGMYAGKIRMVGTEKGVGVRNAGELGASVGSITISADGKIINKGTIQSKNDIKITSKKDITNEKQLNSRQNIQLISEKAIINQGNLIAQKDIDLKANTIKSNATSILAAGIDEQGKLTQKGDIKARAENITLIGKNLAGKHIEATAKKDVVLANSQNVAESMTLTAENININTAKINSNQNINLNATNTIDSRDLHAQTHATYSAHANLIDSQQSIILADKDITVNANKVNNAQAKLKAGNEINFSAEQLFNNYNATLLAEGAINLQSQYITNNESLLVSNDYLQIKANTLENQKSKLQSKKHLTIKSHLLDNQQSELLTDGALTIDSHQINNQKTVLSAKGDINIDSSLIKNDFANIITTGKLNFQAENIDNTQADIRAAKLLSINANDINNASAFLLTNSTLQLQGNNINNNQAELNARDNIVITAQQLLADDGLFISNNDIQVKSNQIAAQNVKIKAKGNINLNATDDIDATKGLVISEKQTNIVAEKVKLNAATLSAKDNMTVKVNSQLDNNEAKWISEGSILVNAQTFNNQNSSISSYKNILFNTPNLNNNNSQLLGYGAININSATINNQHTIINARDDIHLLGNSIDNQNAQIISQQSINVNGDEIDNRHLAMQANKALLMTARNKLDNTDATLISGHKLQLESALIDNQRAKMKSAQDVILQGKNINNQQSIMIASGKVKFNAEDLLDNQQADIRTQGQISMVATKINNQNNLLVAGEEVILNANELNNQSSTLKADENINVKAKSLNNSSSKWVSQNKINVEGDEVNNQASIFKANNGITLKTSHLNNDTATLISGGQLSLSAEKLSNQSAYFNADQAIDIESTELDNQSATIISNDSILIHANKTNNQQATLSAKQNITLNSDEINNQQSLWLADKDITIHAHNLDNHNSAMQAKQGMLIDVNANFANQHATLIAGQKGLAIQAGNVDNQTADLNSQGLLTITANDVNNYQSKFVAEGDLTVQANDINNQKADIQAKGNIALDGQSIDNQYVKLLSTQNIQLTATSHLTNNNAQLTAGQQIKLQSKGAIDNQNSTSVANKGILIEADTINNKAAKLETSGLLKIMANYIANHSVILNAGQIELTAQLLENPLANIIAETLLNIQADDIVNTKARLLANNIAITANQLSGDGDLLAENNIDLNLATTFNNKKSLLANQQISIKASQINNEGKLSSGKSIILNSDEVENKSSGHIESEQININSKLLVNKGLIDGDKVNLITSKRFDNLDGARLYGDQIYIKTNEANNFAASLASAITPTIAARNGLIFDVNTINNANHALILSLGDMQINGQTLNNHSARIETANNMALKVNQINNINDHIETKDVLLSSQQIVEYSPLGSSKRFKPNEVTVRTSPKKRHRYPVLSSKNGAFNSTHKYYEYNYKKNTYETQITVTEPAEIISGNNVIIQSDHIENENSKIIAGNGLFITTNTLNNHSLQGKRTIIDEGNQGFHSRHKGKRRFKTEYTKRIDWDKYYDKTVTTIDLHHVKMEEHANVNNTTLETPHRENVAVEHAQVVKPVTTVVKTNQSIDDLPKSIIDSGKAKGNIAISTNTDIANLTGSNTITETETVPSSNNSTQDININQNSKRQYTESITYVEPNITIPKNSLYNVNKTPQSPYLIETDPKFTNRKKWLSSDYMFNRLRVDPNNIQKRLGDGYYEQQLIQEQIIALTGQRYIGDYASDIEQYKALMNAGVEFAQQYGLSIGASLSAEQMKLLTNDIVWMETKTIIADGQSIEVLVPQVYLVNRPKLTSEGALLAGKDVTVIAEDDIDSSGVILGKNRVAILANNVNNRGTINAGDIVIKAKDSINSSGQFNGDKRVQLEANNDINLMSTTSTTASYYGKNKSINTVIDQVSSISVKDGDINLKAGHDINLGAALLVNGGDEGATNIIAGHDIHLSTLKTEKNQETFWSKNNYRKVDIENIVGSEILTNGDLNLLAGNDIEVKAADITSNKSLKLLAEHDINISSEQEREQLTDHQKAKTKGFLNKGSITDHIETDNITQKGSELSGDSVTMQAGHDLSVTGSQVIATHDVNLQANNNVTIDAAEESYFHEQKTIKKKSGLMGSGGIGITAGKEKEKLKQTDTEQAYVGSVVGSTDGHVNIDAGKNINVKASDVIAKQNIKIQGENVNIEALDAKTTYKEEYSYEKSGLTVALTGTVADMYEAAKAVERAKEKGNDKILALQSIKSALAAIDALEDTQLKNQQGQSQASIGISAMLGTQRTERKVNEEQHNVISSSISAGQDVTIIATGNEHQQNGDITIKGSEVRAGNDINLAANRDINVIGAVNTQHSDRDEKSYGGGVGIQLQFGGDESGLRFKGNANFSRERENADGSAWTESIVEAKNKLNIKTGNDANIIAGQLKGDTVKMDIGNNLNIQSLQDTDDYDYEKISASVSGTGGFGGFSANGSLSATNIDSKWASVTDQSGIFAGKGGYDITVGNNTDLKGAVIASEAQDISKNKLDTGTISFSDIKNKANFKVSHISVSGGTGGASAPTAYQNSDKASSTTKSAVEKGQLIVRNQEEQQQDINKLSRDTASANDPLKQIFDKDKELDKIETVELVKDIAQQAKNVVNKYDRIQAQNDVDKNKDKLSKAEAEKAYKALSDEEKAKYKSVDDYYEQNKASCYYAAVDTQLKANQEKNKNLGTMGGNVSKGIDTATSIVMGIINGDITGGLAGASAPWIAEQIKLHTGHKDEKGEWKVDDPAANYIAHAILGAVVAELQGNSGLAGGAGAVGGEIAADIIRKAIYAGKDAKDLTEAEKQNISALAQLAAGLATAAGGGDAGDVGTAISSSKNAVENNYLNSSDHQDKVGLEYKEKKGELTDKEKLKLAELRAKDLLSNDALLEACVDVSSEACRVERQKAYDALRTYRLLTYENPPEKQTGYQEIQHLLESTSNTPEANELRAKYNGLVATYKRWGYDDEDAQVMAGRTIGTMIILYGGSGTITIPQINKILSSSKLLAAGKGTTDLTSKYSGNLVKVNKPDPAADALAQRIGGESRVRFTNDIREFDVISDSYVAQTKPALKQLNAAVRNQMKATFEAAKETNRSVYYHFEGQPAQSVINKLNEYSKRYGVKVVIDTKPLNLTK